MLMSVLLKKKHNSTFEILHYNALLSETVVSEQQIWTSGSVVFAYVCQHGHWTSKHGTQQQNTHHMNSSKDTVESLIHMLWQQLQKQKITTNTQKYFQSNKVFAWHVFFLFFLIKMIIKLLSYPLKSTLCYLHTLS